jgi:hypothetical protein
MEHLGVKRSPSWWYYEILRQHTLPFLEPQEMSMGTVP